MKSIAAASFLVIGLTGCGVATIGGGRGEGSGNGGSGAGISADGVPCDVQAMLALRCATCHGAHPLTGVPMSLVSYADLTAPSRTMPARTNADLAVARMRDTTMPMPPLPGSPVDAAEIAALEAWIAAGYPRASCGAGTADPFGVPPTCTSGVTWRDGSSALMDPGRACIACHSSGEGPRFALAGTVYPTAHEPDLCYGADGMNGATVVISAADGKVLNLTPNAAGNFSYSGALAAPYRAKVVFMGRERVMADAQTSGDCNACHTQTGAMNAPGRILLP